MLKPASQRVGLLLLILASAPASPVFGQTIQMFTDQPTFAATAANLTTIDFASQLSPGQVLGQITGPGGLTVDGVQFQGLPTNFLYVVAPGYSFPYQGWNGNPTVLQSLAPMGTTLVVTLPSGTTAVGTYIYTIQGVVNPPPVYAFGASVPVDVALVNGQTQTFDVKTSGPPTLAFVGFTSTSPIASLTFHAPTVPVSGAAPGGYVNLANFSFQIGCQATAIGQPVPPGLQFIGTVDAFSGGRLSRDGKPEQEYAIFAPGADPNGSNPLSLQGAANLCGFDRFNWQQTITNLPAPTDPSKCNLGGPFNSPLSPPNCLAAISNPMVVLTAGPPPTGPSFLDPVPGGYTYELIDLAPGQVDDANPFYYTQADLTSRCLEDFNGVPGCTPIQNPNVNSIGGVLLFQDAPANPLLPSGQYENFTTSLVGIHRGGSTSSLFSWSWKTNFNGTTLGGVAKNLLLPNPASGTGGVTITSINGVPQTPPTVSCSATPTILWPPNGRPVEITVSGMVTPGTQVIADGGNTYAVADAYGQVQPSGGIVLGAAGNFSFVVSLIAARNGSDLNGRTYDILVRAADKIGNVGSCSALVTVPHDQRN